MGPFVARIRRKPTQYRFPPTDTWPAWKPGRFTDSNNRRSIEDAARDGQGLTKKNGLGLPSRLFINGARGRTRTGTAFATTPSRWRVYQFHHPGINLYSRSGRSDPPVPLAEPSSLAGTPLPAGACVDS